MEVRDNLIESQLRNMQNEILRVEERAEQKLQLEEQLKYTKITLQLLREDETNVKKSKNFIIKYQASKRAKDTETIQQALKLASSLVWKKSPIHIQFEEIPGGRVPQTILVNNLGTEFNPSVEDSEGAGLAENVSLLTDISVLQATNFIKSLFFDEYYSSVSPSNSESISELLNSIIDGRFQFTFIEQKEEIVRHTEYIEFLVDHDGSKSHIRTFEVKRDGSRRELTLDELRSWE